MLIKKLMKCCINQQNVVVLHSINISFANIDKNNGKIK